MAGLENLQSVFGQIEYIDPITSANSPNADKSENPDFFGQQSPFPKADNQFRSNSAQLKGKTTLLDKLHSFGSQGQHTDVIKIDRINTLQFPSPISDSLTDSMVRSNTDISKRSEDLFEELGRNNNLGTGRYKLESLYNKDHTGVTDRIAINTNRVDENGAPILINTLRSGMGSIKNLNIRGYSDIFRTSPAGGEPYVVNEIGVANSFFGGDNRDTIPWNKSLEDASRLSKFYSSFAGLSFIGKENITANAINFPTNDPFRTPGILASRISVPPLPLPMTGFMNSLNQSAQSPGSIATLRKPFLVEYSDRNKTPFFPNSSMTTPFGQLGDKKVVPSIKPGTFKDEVVRKKTPFLDLSKGPKYTDYTDVYSNARVFDEKTNTIFKDIVSEQGNNGDFYVRIKDLRTNHYIYFRGFVTGITENVNSNFNPVSYIGRSEDVYIYEKGSRDLSFNLRVAPANRQQFANMYQKLNALTSLAYPQYLPEVGRRTLVDVDFDFADPDPDNPEAELETQITETKTEQLFNRDDRMRMKAPFCELYMGQIGAPSRGQFGFFQSMTYNVNESGDWDALTQLPRVFDIALTYKIIHRETPSNASIYYGASVKQDTPVPGNTDKPLDQELLAKQVDSAKEEQAKIMEKTFPKPSRIPRYELDTVKGIIDIEAGLEEIFRTPPDGIPGSPVGSDIG